MIDPRIVAAFDASHPFSLEEHLVFLGRVGSHSHGTYVPPTDPDAIDDVDYLGVVLPPPTHVLGLSRFEGWNWQHEELDVVLYSLDKFVRLLAKSNPNVLGTLWLRSPFIEYATTPWHQLQQSRGWFATKAAYPAFCGYAYGQLKKMTAFDLAAQQEWDAVQAVLARAGWTVEQIVTDAHTPMPADPTLTKEELEAARVATKRIHARHFQGYMGQKRKRLVQRHGYDTKNAAHLIRLMRMCVEFLADGELRVFRTADADELRAIKAGAWPLERVQAEAERLFAAAKEAVTASPLPEAPDPRWVSELMSNLHFLGWQGYR